MAAVPPPEYALVDEDSELYQAHFLSGKGRLLHVYLPIDLTAYLLMGKDVLTKLVPGNYQAWELIFSVHRHVHATLQLA